MLTKAKIKVLEENGSKEFHVLFNPTEYNLSSGANYAEKNIPGVDGPIMQYISGAAQSLTMTLVFDTYHGKTSLNPLDKYIPTDVSKETQKIEKLTRIVGSLHRPPMVQFIWGSLSFKGVVTDVQQNFTMFLGNGMPVRAKLEVTFQSVIDLTKSKREMPFESPDRTKRKTIRQGNQLWNIAWEEYGDAQLWRVLAKENGISNPLDIKPGQVLKIPAL